jgi:hypothetical protein
MEEDTLRLVDVDQVHPAVFASVLLLAGYRTVDLECMRNSAAAWDLADAAAAQGWSLPSVHDPDVDLLLTTAGTDLVVKVRVLVETAAWRHYASGATGAACHA